MLIVFRTLLAAGAALASLAAVAPALAADRPNIVAMGEDADEDSIPRNNRIFNRVIAELGETMNVNGYNVYDETSVAMGFSEPGRVRRHDTELIDVARSVQNPPVDVIAVFQIYASAQKSTYSDIVRPEVRIPGRLLNVRTGQSLGSFEVTGEQLPPLPQNCDRECLLEHVGADAKILAGDLGAALSQKLDGFMAPAHKSSDEALNDDAPTTGGDADAPAPAPTGDRACGSLPTAYSIKVNGFTPNEVTAIEEYLTAFSCYEHQRPVRASASATEYWYETRSDSARLNRNLRLMLQHMNATGQVSFAGNTFVVTKVATR